MKWKRKWNENELLFSIGPFKTRRPEVVQTYNIQDTTPILVMRHGLQASRSTCFENSPMDWEARFPTNTHGKKSKNRPNVVEKENNMIKWSNQRKPDQKHMQYAKGLIYENENEMKMKMKMKWKWNEMKMKMKWKWIAFFNWTLQNSTPRGRTNIQYPRYHPNPRNAPRVTSLQEHLFWKFANGLGG
jgi:hypothetical protein